MDRRLRRDGRRAQPVRRERGRDRRPGRSRRRRGRGRRGPRRVRRPRGWRATAVAERAGLLRRIADLLQRDKEQIAHVETLDTGKTLVESRIDVDDVTAVFRYYADLATTQEGRLVDVGLPHVLSRVAHEPVGVCVLITPWNYPLLQLSWKVAPALAAGCTCA